MPHDDQPSDRQGEEVLSAARESSFERAVPVYLALLMAIGTVVALLLLYELRHVVLLVFISLLFAAAASRPAALLQRLRIPEGISVVVIYLLTLALFGLIVWFIVPPLLSQIANFGDDLPSYIERFKSIGRTYDRIQREYPQLHSFDDQLSSIGGRVVAAAGRWLTTLPTKLFALFLDVLSVVVMSIMIVTSRRRILRLILMLVGPRYRTQTRAILVEMWLQLGHYLRAKVIEMTIIGGITFVVLYLLHMPFPLLLAIVVALGELIPRIGPWLARIPLLVFAAFEGWVTFGLVALASVLIENAKGFVISPLVEGNQLDVHPLLILIAVLTGSTLFGAGGAFVAVPAAAIVQVFFNEVIVPWRNEQIEEDQARQALEQGEPPGG